MVYDWNGVRARRVKLYKTGTAFLLGIAVLSVPLVFFFARFHDLYG
jgi:hypothetical protein